MSSIIRPVLEEDKILLGTGNRGINFPLFPACPIIDQPEAEITDCIIVQESGSLNEPIIFETGTEFVPFTFQNFLIFIECPTVSEDQCWLAFESDGFTKFFFESSNDFLSTPCIIT